MHVEIRQIMKNDLNPIFRLEESVFADQAFSPSYFEYLFLSHSSGFFVLLVEHILAGYCIAVASSNKESADLISIAVAQHVRQRRLGSKLLQRCLQWAIDEKLKTICLMVAVPNLPARKLYDDFGFVQVKRVSHYYGEGQDAFYMCRTNTS